MVLLPNKIGFFQTCDGRPELKIGGDGNLEHMQKCIGEILDEENDQSINETMADTNKNNDTLLTKMSEPVSDDLGKFILENLFLFLYFLFINIKI